MPASNSIRVPWTTDRANLLVDGIEFDESWGGRKLHIGTVELVVEQPPVVTKETIPCSVMDAQHQVLTAALATHWRGGVLQCR
jgi:MOSC domain-containing protein YiiM